MRQSSSGHFQLEPFESRVLHSGATDAAAATEPAPDPVARPRPAAHADRSSVRFADPALETIVRRSLGVPRRAITPGDMLRLTRLEANAFLLDVPVIRSLKGLGYARNLYVLDIAGHEVSDLRPIARLTQLRSLDLAANRVADVSVVGAFCNLERLSISRNPIEAGTADLANLLSLTRFVANHCGLTSLRFLRNLEELRYVEADGNKINDVSGLRGKAKLELLFLSGNRISDLSPLQGLRALDTVDLSHNRVSDIRPLLYTGGSRMRIVLAGNELDLREGSRASRVIARLRASGTNVVLND